MTILDNYLLELFGLFAPSGDKVCDPIINKMNSEIIKANKGCNNNETCIKEKMLKIKKETRSELIKNLNKCQGRRPCHKIIMKNVQILDTEITNLKR